MIKNLLRILASSVTFVAVMLVTSITVAQPEGAIALTQTESVAPVVSSVSLNVISPSLESCQANNSLLDHLGCSCTTCAQGA